MAAHLPHQLIMWARSRASWVTPARWLLLPLMATCILEHRALALGLQQELTAEILLSSITATMQGPGSSLPGNRGRL